MDAQKFSMTGAVFDVVDIAVEPNQCPLAGAMDLQLRIKTHSAVQVTVNVRYIFDIAHLKQEFPVNNGSVHTINAGESSVTVSCPDLDLSAIPHRVLNNVAVLVLTISDVTGSILCEKKLVVQIYDKDLAMYRTVFSPFS